MVLICGHSQQIPASVLILTTELFGCHAPTEQTVESELGASVKQLETASLHCIFAQNKKPR